MLRERGVVVVPDHLTGVGPVVGHDQPVEGVVPARTHLAERQAGLDPLGTGERGDAVALGQVEAWARSEDNPVGGWYGLRKGYRGRFGTYVPPVLEHLGLAELEHQPRNNRMRARE